MKKRIMVFALVLFFILGTTVHAGTSLNSKGKIEFGQDVVFDANDLNSIKDEITSGKQNIVNSIKTCFPDSDVTVDNSFDELSNSINDVYKEGQKNGFKKTEYNVTSDSCVLTISLPSDFVFHGYLAHMGIGNVGAAYESYNMYSENTYVWVDSYNGYTGLNSNTSHGYGNHTFSYDKNNNIITFNCGNLFQRGSKFVIF